MTAADALLALQMLNPNTCIDAGADGDWTPMPAAVGAMQPMPGDGCESPEFFKPSQPWSLDGYVGKLQQRQQQQHAWRKKHWVH